MMMQIKLQALDDHDKPLYPDLEGKLIALTNASRAGVLQSGTQKGKVSVALFGETPSGQWVSIQITAKLLHTLNDVVKGAESRWGVE